MHPSRRKEGLEVARLRLLLRRVHLVMTPQPLCDVMYPAGYVLRTQTPVRAEERHKESSRLIRA